MTTSTARPGTGGQRARFAATSKTLRTFTAIAVPIVKEASDLAKAKGLELTPASLEGFASAKVLVEGLRRAGREPTRASLRTALEGFNRVNIGGLELSYSPTSHTGLDYADLSIIGQDGKFKR